MVQTIAARYRRWFEYECDSHLRVLRSLEAVPPSQHATGEFQNALTLLAHMTAARQLWLFRLGVGHTPPSEFFPRGLPLAEIARRVDAVQQTWLASLERLDDHELARTFEYRSYEGDWYKNTVEDILTQLFGHSWYHRGQVAASLRSIGSQPAATDFVYWAREAIPPRD